MGGEKGPSRLGRSRRLLWCGVLLVAAAGCPPQTEAVTPAAPPTPAQPTPAPAPPPSAGPPAEAAAAPDACGGDPLTVIFYDAGQALAALVELPDGRHVLVDAGESPTRAGCGAPCRAWNDRVVAGVMADLGGAPIDLLWITHQHSDHHGGLAALVAAGVTITHYVDNGTRATANGVTAARTEAAAAGASLAVVAPGATNLPVDGGVVSLSAIVPPAWPVNDCDSHPNECSIGLQLSYCTSVVLFTGDAETSAEAAWPVGDVSLLQVGHHGSDTSTSQAFVDRVTPEYAVISSGRRDEGTNRTYCHPRKSTVDRLTTATGGPSDRRATVFDASQRTCKHQQPQDWQNVAVSEQLWLTSVDHTVRLETTGDGSFRRVVNVNTAAAPELETLPGIGPVRAAAIISTRESDGPFADADDLESVSGIGPATVAALRDHVRF